MSELIGIREAARRLGVSDTAVHKAIKAGRITIAGRTPTSDRPLLSWPAVADDWKANSAEHKRTHVGPTGTSPTRAKYAGTPDVELNLHPASKQAKEQPPAEPEADAPAAGKGPSYAQSRAIREAYQARLAKLEYEEKSGKLMSVDQVKADAFKTARSVRDALLNLPDRVSHELAHETDPARVHEKLTREIRTALEALAVVA